jgi:carboxyl-terminal processing protease
VPLEGKHGAEMIALFLQSGLMNYFVFEQLDQNRKAFTNMSISEIRQELVQNSIYFKAFKSRMKESGLLLNLEQQKAKVLQYMHAEFVQQLFTDQAYYQLLLKEDKMVNKVLKR